MNITKILSWLSPVLMVLLLLTTACSRSGSKMEVQLEDGKILATLTETVTETNEPANPTKRFWDDSEEILLSLCLKERDIQDSVPVHALLRAIEVRGKDSLFRIADSSYAISNTWDQLSFSAPAGGFTPGKYRVILTAGKDKLDSLDVRIRPRVPYAQQAWEYDPKEGLNIAAASLGGKVDTVLNAQGYDQEATLSHLIDGTPRACFLKMDSLPTELVFSFHQNYQAKIQAIVIDTWSGYSQAALEMTPKYVEILGSKKSPAKGFKTLASARLYPNGAKQRIPFSAVKIKYLKLRILSNYGSDSLAISEVKIIEEPDPAVSAVDPLLRNLINPELGGNLVRFTSQSEPYGTLGLTDGDIENAWRSSNAYRPQNFVFGFYQHETALIEKIVLRFVRDQQASTRPRQIGVYYSLDSPLGSFKEAGSFTLDQDSLKQELVINLEAKYVKIRILENFGGAETGIGEMSFYEGSQNGYESIFIRGPEKKETGEPWLVKATLTPTDTSQTDRQSLVDETEPNNYFSKTNELTNGVFVNGKIQPLGESDYYALDVEGDKTASLTMELKGFPHIRTSIKLYDESYQLLKHFDPGHAPGQDASFTWVIEPGRKYIQVSEPPVSMAIIWDTSSGMTGNMINLEQAVKTYLKEKRPDEKLNFIRFASSPQVLLPKFTDDVDSLETYSNGQFCAEGGTTLYDAVSKGIQILEPQSGNRAMIFLTDGNDSKNGLDYASFWKLLEEKGLRIYTIGFGSNLDQYSGDVGTYGKNLLANIANATDGRSFFTKDSKQFGQFYKQIADEMRLTSSYLLKPSISTATGDLRFVFNGGQIEQKMSAVKRIEFILDASASMKQKDRMIDGQLKIDVVVDALTDIARKLPKDKEIALRAFGHRLKEGDRGDCKDSQLLVSLGKNNRAALIRRVQRIIPKGSASIAYSLEKAAKDFGKASGPKKIVLITDGKDDCEGSPVASMKKMKEEGIKIQVDVIGLHLKEGEDRKEMEKLASLSGGRYFHIESESDLQNALEGYMTKTTSADYEITDASGKVISSGPINEEPQALLEGFYTLRINTGGHPLIVPNVQVCAGESTIFEIKKAGQEIAFFMIGGNGVCDRGY